MKTAGSILSALFDEQFMKKAEGASKLFDSWTDITEKNGIASAAAHSRIKDLDRGILLVEMDHPGWKQILQTKQSKLLNDFRRRFPDLNISGISLMLGKGESQKAETSDAEEAEELFDTEQADVEPTVRGYDAIKDEGFKEALKELGKSIAAREKSKKRS
ncbi:MAG: DUF721 domain-containing protein [Treponema sp.]|jgi:hypothetical protein|nr:DUF721 domain-containing protein [Treponema sp.]